MSLVRWCWILASAGLLAACAAPPPPAPVPVAAAPAPAASAPVEVPPPLTAPQAQKLALAAVDLLEAGLEDQAKTDLERVIASDSNHKLAQSLLRQISADPVSSLGRESFAYTVKPSDTLSRIAGRYMGDIYSFYILARYNGIKVPRQVAGGQVIRIPGKAPPPGALDREPARMPDSAVIPAVAPPTVVPAPAVVEPSAGERALRAGEAAERSGDLERAHTEYRRAASFDQPDAAAKAERVRRTLVSRYTVSARSAFAKQDLDGAIRQWDRVLGVEPDNDVARLERQRAMALKDKIKSLK